MKYKKLFLPLFFLILLFSFNSNVLAKTEIGSCEYTRTGGSGAATFKVKIFDNETLQITENNVYQDIAAPFIIQMINTGRCYPIALLSKGGGFTKNTITFFDSMPSNSSSYDGIYALTTKTNSATTCYYDIRIDTKNQDYNSKYARLKLEVPENASRFFFSFMDSSKNFPKNINVSDYITGNWFYGEKGTVKAGVVQYDLANKGSLYADFSDSRTYSDVLNKLKSNTCPSGRDLGFLVNYSYDKVYLFFKTHDLDESNEYPTLQSDIVFKESSSVGGGAPSSIPQQGGSSSGTVITQEGASQTPQQVEKECILTGLYSRKNSGKEEDKFTFNFKYQISPSTEPYFGIQMGSSYKYSSLTNNHVLPDENIHFTLASDLLQYIRGLSYNSSFECLKSVNITYKGESTGEEYELSISSTTGSVAIHEGETGDPQTSEMHSQEYKVTGRAFPEIKEAETVTGCNILGDRFLKYLRSILFWLQVFVPILALVLSMVELMKAIASAEEDAKKKAIKATKTRLIASAIILLLPFIIQVILMIADNSEGQACVHAFMNSK